MTCPSCDTLLDVTDYQPFDAILCPTCTQELMVPARLDHYLLISLLGEGSMGSVYLAIDEHLQRHVAVKLLRSKFGSDPMMWTRLEQEAKSAAAINHPNVVHVFRLGRQHERPYIIMELVDNDHLDAMMKREGPLPEAEVVRIGIEVMGGLQAAHDVGLVHGDVKPANLLIGKRGRVKVGDFGLARFAEQEDEVKVWGTPYYLAPEKAKMEQEDFRSDLYSLGATLFHALTGQPPFNGPGSKDVIQNAMHAPTPLACDVRPDASEALSRIIAKMMAKDPGFRYQSYQKAQAALEAYASPSPAPSETRNWWQRFTGQT